MKRNGARLRPRPVSILAVLWQFMLAFAIVFAAAYLQSDIDESERIIAKCGEPSRISKRGQ